MSTHLHIFVDAQLSPEIADWLQLECKVTATHVFALGAEERKDPQIFKVANVKGGVILSKDADFVWLVKGKSASPAVIWLRCGNLPDRQMKRLLAKAMPMALALIRMGERIVEINDLPPHARKRRTR